MQMQVEAHKVHVYMPNATAVLADPSSAARFFEVCVYTSVCVCVLDTESEGQRGRE